MSNSLVFFCLAILALLAFSVGRQRATAMAEREASALNSLPRHYGYLTAAHAVLPALLMSVLWFAFGDNLALALTVANLPPELETLKATQFDLLLDRIQLASDNRNPFEANAHVLEAASRFRRIYGVAGWVAAALIAATALTCLYRAYHQIRPRFTARKRFDRILKTILMISSLVAVLTTIGIIMTLVVESSLFFRDVSVTEFLFGTKWSPQTALRDDQIGASGSFGALPLFAGTLLITFVAILVAGPVGLMAAIYLTQYASPSVRAFAKPCLEVLAGIPTVVYGFFAAVTVAPFLSNTGASLGLDIASESALAAGLVMGVMIIPFVSSLTDDALTAVPGSLKNASLALGATQSETIAHVLIPTAFHGISSAILLAISRAMGETMIVVMAAGMRPNLTANPFEAVTTVTVQIVALLTGDQEFDSPKTLSAFALGLVLFVFTLIFNLFAQRVSRRHAVHYD